MGRRRTSTVLVIFQASIRMPMPWPRRIIQDVPSELSSRYRKMVACMKMLARMVRKEMPTLSFFERQWDWGVLVSGFGRGKDGGLWKEGNETYDVVFKGEEFEDGVKDCDDGGGGEEVDVGID